MKMTPKNKFYEVSVKFEIENNGKLKKETKKYLIDAKDIPEAEKNTFKLLEGTMYDWEIISISLSKINEIYIDD